MALRRIALRRRPLLPVPRAFFSSNPPFPPPPPQPPANDPDASQPPSSPPPNPGAPRNPSSSLFGDLRDRLRSSHATPPPRRIPMRPSRPNPELGGTRTTPPLSDVRRMLENFHRNNDEPSPHGTTPSFVDLIKDKDSSARPSALGSLDKIRKSLKHLPPQQRTPRPPLPYLSPDSPVFNRERDRNAKAGGPGKEEDKDSAFTLTRSYSYEELGKRLGELRPAGAAKDGKDWFSLEELQGRIAKLVELDKQEDERPVAGFDLIRKGISNIVQNQNKPKPTWSGSFSLGSVLSLGQNKDYLRLPPQEELVERYFHPDHTSSEENMKLELQRVRDEFKMSENDCGSARVQIAQLTLKIKHLSAVLHKKDKHSRKGLQETVQRRKKYLKYLRRTDWDSYCLVLSKLGLRDVPEYKAPDYKSKPMTRAKSKKNKSKKKRKMKA